MCARASAIYALLFVYIHIHIHTCTCLRSKGGRELGERVGRRVGGGAASAWHCHFQGERGEQNCKCNHRQANKYTVSFFRLPFVILLWRSRCITISFSHSLCVQQRGQLCALRSTGRRVLRGVGVAACLQLSLLLLDLFCIQRTATHTTHQRRARTHIHTYTSGVHACMCMHTYSYLFIICILLQKIMKNFSSSWPHRLQLTHLIHGRFGQVQADGAAKRSRDAIGKLLVCSGSSSS